MTRIIEGFVVLACATMALVSVALATIDAIWGRP